MEYLLIGIFLILIVGFVISYNKLVALKEQVVNSEKEISIQLDRRGKIFDNLINMVKKSMDYEKTTLKEVVELRNKIINLDSIQNKNEKKELENKLSELIASGSLNSSINMTMEAYPDLKANNNMLHFQEEIVTTENKLSYAKQAYNASIEEYNATKGGMPYNFIVSKFPKLDETFNYWKISEEKIKEEEEKRVSFD